MSEPECFTLYRFFSADDTLLYIGLTVNPGKRMEKHRGEKSWWSDVARIAMEQHPDLAALRIAERTAIQQEKPLHNVRMNGHTTGRLTKPNGARVDDSYIDGLIGRFFHSFRDLESERDEYATIIAGRAVQWQGHVLEELGPDLYLVELFSWWDGCANGRQLAKVDEMLTWRFYDSALEMQLALPCGEHDSQTSPCGGEREYFHEMGDFGLHLICAGCRKRYPGFARYKPIIWRKGRAYLR